MQDGILYIKIIPFHYILQQAKNNTLLKVASQNLITLFCDFIGFTFVS
jgi:hypothetical protein